MSSTHRRAIAARARQHGYRSPVEELNEQAEVALENLRGARDFVRDFAQGKISLKTFLRGPLHGDLQELVESEEPLLELLDMVEQLDRAARGASRSARAKSRRGRAV